MCCRKAVAFQRRPLAPMAAPPAPSPLLAHSLERTRAEGRARPVPSRSSILIWAPVWNHEGSGSDRSGTRSAGRRRRHWRSSAQRRRHLQHVEAPPRVCPFRFSDRHRSVASLSQRSAGSRDRAGLSWQRRLSLGAEQGRDRPGSLIVGVLISSHRGSQTVAEADLQKASSALLMSLEPGAVYAKQRDPSCDLEKSELCCTHGVVKELLDLQDGSAARVPNSPQAREATSHKHENATCECAGSEKVENGFCTSDGSVKETRKAQDGAATWSKKKRALGGFLAPGEWIRSHPWIILVVLILLVVLALVVALSVQSVRSVPDTPVLLACPKDWIGYNGICYFLSRDLLSWDQAQARCSELGASLAVLRDEEMEFLFPFSTNVDYWLGLRRRDQRLQWGDGSSFSSSFEVLGNAECVFLSENHLRSTFCSNEMPFVCSRAQTRL